MRFKGILFITLLFLIHQAGANNNFSIKTVVIDAGHGGKDPGASGPGKTNEKDVALKVALQLGDLITKNFPDVNVIYTRKTDVFIELHERAEIANKAKADLFIAIHCNSSPNPEFYGTSTYVLGLHRTEANLEVAKRENSVILLEEDRDKNYEFDPNSPEGHIIMSMKQNAFLDQSIAFASKAENQFENGARRKSLGVKQAGFYVLYKTTMPSLLAEIGFVSNPEEERYLVSAKGQEQIANSLLNAFKDYKAEMEGGGAEVSNPVKQEPATTSAGTGTGNGNAAATTTEKPATTSEPVVEKEHPGSSDFVDVRGGKRIHKPIENSSGGGKGGPATSEPVVTKEEPAPVKEEPKPKTENKPEPKKEEPKKEVVESKPEPVKEEPVVESKPEPKKEEPKPVVKKEEPKPVVKTEPKPVVTEAKEEPTAYKGIVVHRAQSGTYFKVQLFALKGELKEYSKVIKLFTKMSAEELSNGFTRYYAGNEKSYGTAKQILDVAKANGYSSAYVVGYKDGVRLTPEQMKAYE